MSRLVQLSPGKFVYGSEVLNWKDAFMLPFVYFTRENGKVVINCSDDEFAYRIKKAFPEISNLLLSYYRDGCDVNFLAEQNGKTPTEIRRIFNKVNHNNAVVIDILLDKKPKNPLDYSTDYLELSCHTNQYVKRRFYSATIKELLSEDMDSLSAKLLNIPEYCQWELKYRLNRLGVASFENVPNCCFVRSTTSLVGGEVINPRVKLKLIYFFTTPEDEEEVTKRLTENGYSVSERSFKNIITEVIFERILN